MNGTPTRGAVRQAVAHGVARYRVGLSAVAAVLVLLALLPDGPRPAGQASEGGAGPGRQFTTVDPTPERSPGRPKGGRAGTAADGPASGAAAPAAPAPSVGGGTRAAAATTTTAPRAAAPPVTTLLSSPTCDVRTGRLAVPTRYAPPCVSPVAGNGGPSHPGVTAEAITVAVYLNRSDPATAALFRATGFTDADADVEATYRAYVDYFESHYQTWGRKVELVFVRPSGPDGDAVAARADAVRVATEIGAFASWGGPLRTTAYADELAARRVLCVCTESQSSEYYARWTPYVLPAGLSSTQADLHRAEYIGKRLAGRPARHAGDVLLAGQPRRFGLLYSLTAERAGTSDAEFFERQLTRYGVELTDKAGFTGADSDPAGTQDQARELIARLKASGVTTILYSGDPLSPVLFTQEATRQRYSPEWVVMGSAFTDTAFFARTYDQTQWVHAFGLSFGAARLPREHTDAWTLHVWHHGRPPQAAASFASVYSAPFLFFTGMHLGGPLVTPHSIVEGLSRFPPAGAGALTDRHLSFGRHGIWPFDDFGGADDATEVWWDATAAGPDEAGQSGLGMYRYVAGGRRYLPGGHPRDDDGGFVRDGAVTVYPERPPSDRPPAYAHSD